MQWGRMNERDNVSMNLTRGKAKGFLLVFALAIIGLMVACSSDEDPTALPDTPTATTAPSATATQVPQDTPTAMPEPTVAETVDTPTQDDAASDAAPIDEPVLSVVTTSNIVADWVRNVGGERVDVQSLLPVGGDPHSFHPTARDAAKVADADLVMTVGLGLEAAWLNELLNNIGSDRSNLIALAEHVDAIEFAETGAHDDHGDEDADEDGHGDEDTDEDGHGDEDADEDGHGDEDADEDGHGDEHMEDEDEHGDEDTDEDGHGDEHEDEDGHGDEGESLTGRLLIGDGENAALSILDLTTGDIDAHALEVAAPNPTLYWSPSERFGERFVFAIVRGPEDGDDRVHVFDGGIYLEEHGDHYDLVTSPVTLMDTGTSDQRPVHVSRHHGYTAIFHDATGRIALFEEHELEHEGDEYEPTWLEAGLQHGAAVPLGDNYVVVSSNNPDYPDTAQSSLPLGVEVWTTDGTVVYDASSRDCPGLHGEAPNSHGVMFGCVGGVLFIEGHNGEFEHVFIENPSDMITDARIGSVWGHDTVEPFFGSASYTQEGTRLNGGLWMIDAEGGEMNLVLPATDEKRVVRAEFSADGHEFFVLTADGHLNVIEAETGEIEEEAGLVDADVAASGVSFTIVGNSMFVSEAENGRIFEFSLEDHEIEREWNIDGQPRSLAFVGIGAGDEYVDHDVETDEHMEGEDDHGEEGGHDHAHGPLDPHFWFDPHRVSIATHEIAELLSELDPAGAEMYEANAEAYSEELDDLHTWALEQVSAVPSEQRILVTSHDSLSYFAVLYGFEIVGTVIPGGTTELESTASQLTELIEVIREHNVPVIFGETTVTERIAQTIADETGAELVSLYSGSLGPEGSGAETYVGMIRSNVELIVDALR